ncbi:hypothetical protein JZ751_026333 [Albula glossodonta]|uniref:Tetraspanin n=1 Tax=Albula glossodonta TaxID=121402 RepID=A0A8T2PD65_9TELE|nr:hypothetical protein JZ751_026333 [Albula glossodonta]
MSVSRRCLCCVKYLMFVFNLIFWLGGCGLFGVGVWLSFTQSEFSSLPLSFPSLSAANLLLVAGGVTMITGFLGCLGALKEQRCLLMTFFVILLVLVITEFKCCGVTNQTEWLVVRNHTNGLPPSCCSGEVDPCRNGWSEGAKFCMYCSANPLILCVPVAVTTRRDTSIVTATRDKVGLAGAGTGASA